MPASEFSDVFISYRRLDVEFVKRLVEDLQSDGKEVWVDWEDIPPGAEGFADEIKRGIEGADAFIAVLSPDYLESTYCVDMELQYAVDLKKKIIPLVYKTFEDYPVPRGISHINWIYFIPHAGQNNTYEESFPKILEVMQTDLEHVRQHKRFLLRAIEWDEGNRRNSFLLTGDEIENAQDWLTGAAGKEPIPTDLHRDYISASINHQKRQQRLLMSGVITALIISVILSILSLVGFSNANTAQETAVANYNVASTAKVEAESNEAIASTQRANAENNAELAQTAQYEAERNLMDARQSQALFHGDLAQQQANIGLHQRSLLLALEALKFHGDGIVSDSAFGAIHETLHQPIRQTQHIDFPSGILTMVWHDDQQQVLVATQEIGLFICDETEDCSVRVEIWDILDGELETYLPHDYALTRVFWNQADEQVLTLSHDHTTNQSRIILWDASEETEIYRLDSENFVEWITWQDGNDYFVVGLQSQINCGFGDQPACEYQVDVYDFASGNRVAAYPQDYKTASAEFSPDGQWLEIGLREGFDRLSVIYNFNTGRRLTLYNQSMGDIIWREDGHLVMLSDGETITAQVLGVSEPLYRISSTQPFTIVDTSLLIHQPDGCEEDCQDIQVFNALTGEEKFTTQHATASPVVWTDIIQNGRYLLTRTNDDPVDCTDCETAFYLWSMETGGLVHQVDYEGWLGDLGGNYHLNQSETLMLTYTINAIEHNIIQLWNLETGENQLTRDLDRTFILSVNFDENDRHIIVDKLDEIQLYDVTTGYLQHTLRLTGRVQNVFILTDDNTIVTNTVDAINVWSVTDWDATLHNPIGYVINGEAYNRDKTQIITWSGERRLTTTEPNAYVWDVETGKLLMTLETEAPVMDAEWSPNGREIAVLQWEQECESNCASGTLIFDAETGERVATYDQFGGAGTLSWMPESSHIIRQFDFTVVFDSRNGDVIYQSDQYVPGIKQWNSDFSAFVYQNFDTMAIDLVGYPSGEVIQTFPLTTLAYATHWGFNDQVIAFLVDNRTALATHVVVYDVATAELLYTIENVGLVEASHNDQYFAVYTEDKELRIIDTITGEQQWSHATLNEDWTDLIWSPDDEHIIISGFFALQSQLFEVRTGKLLNTFPYSQLEWSPTGDMILAYDDNVDPPLWRVYSLKTEEVLFSFDPISTPHWRPNGRELVSHDGVWSVEFHELIDRGNEYKIRELSDLELQEFFIKPPPVRPDELQQQQRRDRDDFDEDED